MTRWNPLLVGGDVVPSSHQPHGCCRPWTGVEKVMVAAAMTTITTAKVPTRGNIIQVIYLTSMYGLKLNSSFQNGKYVYYETI
jgi:hypothetical protein